MTSQFLAGQFGGLELVGVQAIIKDLDKYLLGGKRIEAANAGMAKSSQAAATASTAAGTKQLAALTALAGGTALVGVAIGGASLKAAIDFESAFAGVRKTVDATEEEFRRLEQGIRDMALRLPQSTTEIARVAEAAGQLGVETGAILKFTEVMIGLGTATNLSSLEAADALARLANITKLPADEFDRLGATLVDLGNKSAATESEILDFGLRIAGAGEIAGLTEADILGIGAAMASVGVEAEAGGTAVQKVLISITEAAATGGEKLELFAATAGLTVEQFRKLAEENPAEAFILFVEGLARAGDDAFKILDKLELKDQRLIRSFLSLANAGDLLRESIATGNKAFEENTALQTEVERRNKTTAAQIQILKNNFNDLAITIGQILLPALNNLLPVLTFVASGARDAIGEVKSLLGSLQDVGGINVGGATFGGLKQAFLGPLGALAGGLGGGKPAGAQGGGEQFGPPVPSPELRRATQETADLKAEIDRLTRSEEDLKKETERMEAHTRALADGIIDFNEAAELGLSALAAGQLEGTQFVVGEMRKANAEAFEFAKTLTRVAVAFRASYDAGLKALQVIAKESQEKTRAAQQALFGQPTQELARLDLQLAQLQLRQIQSPASAQEAIQKQIDATQKQIDLLNAQNEVANKQITANDKTLQTQSELTRKAAELARQMADSSLVVRNVATAFGDELIPEIEAARDAHAVLKASIQTLAEEQFKRDFIPATAEAVRGTQHLAQATEESASRIEIAVLRLPPLIDEIMGDLRSKLAQPLNPVAGPPAPPTFQHGGFFTGREGLVTLHGPEAVLPLTNPRRAQEILARIPPGVTGASTAAAAGPQVVVNIESLQVVTPNSAEGAVGDVAHSVHLGLIQRGVLRG